MVVKLYVLQQIGVGAFFPKGAAALVDQLISLFPTTLMRRRLVDFAEHNSELAALILELEKEQANAVAGTSTKGGFQTAEDLLSREHSQARHPSVVALKSNIQEAVQEYSTILTKQECALAPRALNYSIWGWGVILRRGNWQGAHVHPNANISGVYYIASPATTLEPGSEEGKISFSDPRPRANMGQLFTQKTRHIEAPTPGDMIIFPSWLEHSVAPFQGPGERICIAFNVRLNLS